MEHNDLQLHELIGRMEDRLHHRLDKQDKSLDSLKNSLDKIDNIVDNHHGRISSVESSITWVRGFIKLGSSILLALVGGLISLIIKLFQGHHL